MRKIRTKKKKKGGKRSWESKHWNKKSHYIFFFTPLHFYIPHPCQMTKMQQKDQTELIFRRRYRYVHECKKQQQQQKTLITTCSKEIYVYNEIRIRLK